MLNVKSEKVLYEVPTFLFAVHTVVADLGEIKTLEETVKNALSKVNKLEGVIIILVGFYGLQSFFFNKNSVFQSQTGLFLFFCLFEAKIFL